MLRVVSQVYKTVDLVHLAYACKLDHPRSLGLLTYNLSFDPNLAQDERQSSRHDQATRQLTQHTRHVAPRPKPTWTRHPHLHKCPNYIARLACAEIRPGTITDSKTVLGLEPAVHAPDSQLYTPSTDLLEE